MTDDEREVARILQEQEREARKGLPSPPRPEPPTIHYTELPDGPPNSPLRTEWDFYRRAVGRLLAEGHQGKWLLIKNEEIVGIWDTEAEANAVRVQRFPREPILMKQIRAREPILRIGYNRLCPS
jgi:hypothetical protein